MRACEVVPLAWDATGSVRDHPRSKPTGHQLSTAHELTIGNHPTSRHVPGMTPIRFLLTTLVPALPLTAAVSPLTAVAAAPPTTVTAPRLTSVVASPSPPDRPPAATWPLQPRPQIVRGFDLPAKPWLPGHRGVDLAGSPGQPVLAATAGTITYAGQLAGRGVIVVSTGPRRTTYEPVVPSLTVGAAVTPGTVIGRLSAAGSHCAPATCLHWGLIQVKQYLNPLTLLPNRPVRLLPHTQPGAAQLHADPPDAAPPGADQPGAHSSSAHSADASPVGARPPSAGAPGADLPRPRAVAEASTPRSGERTAAAVVIATAALTLAAGLLVRRH
jgi:Peptidase family M23